MSPLLLLLTGVGCGQVVASRVTVVRLPALPHPAPQPTRPAPAPSGTVRLGLLLPGPLVEPGLAAAVLAAREETAYNW